MVVRLIRKWWWVDLHFNHTRYRKRSPENSKTGAQAYEASLRHKLARGEQLVATLGQEQTFAEFAEVWFSTYVVPNNKPSEQRTKQLILQNSLIPFFGKMRLHAIGKKDIELYKAFEQKKRISSKTINNRLTVLRKCLATGYDWDVLQSAPPKIKALKSPPPATQFLTPEEAERLLASATGAAREMILTALKTGLRQGELRGLQWEAIDWENRVLTVRHSFCEYTQSLTSPKSNRARHVPIADDLYALLSARRQSTGYVFTNGRGYPFPQYTHLCSLRRAQEKAGLRKIGWHTLRHTFATHLVARGVPIRAVQELLGHSTITMTMRYAHIAAPDLRAAIDLLSDRASSASGQPAGNPV